MTRHEKGRVIIVQYSTQQPAGCSGLDGLVETGNGFHESGCIRVDRTAFRIGNRFSIVDLGVNEMSFRFTDCLMTQA